MGDRVLPSAQMEKDYEIISPLGPRKGPATFDCFYDVDKYSSMEEAVAENDYVHIDFVKDEGGLIQFRGYRSKQPAKRKYYVLDIQRFPFGIDILDDEAGCKMAQELLAENK